MTYWMIEHYDHSMGHQWLRIVCAGHVNGIPRGALDWDKDPQVALHFARKEDAECFAMLHPEWATLALITSHSNIGENTQ